MRPPRRYLSEQTVDHPPDGFLAILPVEVDTRVPLSRIHHLARHRVFESVDGRAASTPPRLVTRILTLRAVPAAVTARQTWCALSFRVRATAGTRGSSRTNGDNRTSPAPSG